jgi:allophanate hydrolase subunit 2
VPLALATVDVRDEHALSHPVDLALDQPVRVVLGPQLDYFTDDAVATLLSSDYVISNQADRMGYRLEGPALAHAKGYNIVSDGTVAGAIQVPGSGQPIILMVDNQTTGGYPKIATVISADIPVVGRRKPGRAISFVAVDVPAAQRLRSEQEAAIRRDIENFRRVARTGEIDLAALYSENLVSGVASAFD